MDADGGSRMRSLHTLDISLSKQEISEALAERLSKVLTRLAPASRLTEFCIYPLETFLSVNPPLSRAIAALTTIEEVRFDDVGERSLELVQSMQAKPTQVTLRGGKYDFFKDAGGGSVLTLLHKLSSSLRELSLRGFGDAAHPTADTPEYPSLSALTLEVTSAPITTWHYVRAFPNLKSFTLLPEPYHRISNARDSQLDLQLRTQNKLVEPFGKILRTGRQFIFGHSLLFMDRSFTLELGFIMYTTFLLVAELYRSPSDI